MGVKCTIRCHTHEIQHVLIQPCWGFEGGRNDHSLISVVIVRMIIPDSLGKNSQDNGDCAYVCLWNPVSSKGVRQLDYRVKVSGS